MKKFLLFMFSMLKSNQEIINQKINYEIQCLMEQEKNDSLSNEAINNRINSFLEQIGFSKLSIYEFNNQSNIEKINKTILEMKNSNKKNDLLYTLHGIRHAIHAQKINQKKISSLTDNKSNFNYFLTMYLLDVFEKSLYDFLLTFLKENEISIENYIYNQIKHGKNKVFIETIDKIFTFFEKDELFNDLMDLILTKCNAKASYFFIYKKNKHVQLINLLKENIPYTLNFFTKGIAEQYKKKLEKNEILSKQNSEITQTKKELEEIEIARLSAFEPIYCDYLKQMNMKLKYPVILPENFNLQQTKEMEIFEHLLPNIVRNFTEQKMEDLTIDNDFIVNSILLIKPPKELLTFYLKNKDENEDEIFNQKSSYENNKEQFLKSNMVKGNNALIKHVNSKDNKKNDPKTNYLLIGSIFACAIILCAYYYTPSQNLKDTI